MSLCSTPRLERIAAAVTGRSESLYAEDCRAREGDLSAIAGARVLIAGGAGSIGAATLLEIADRAPRALCVLDPNENNLAELIRTLRSREPAFTGELVVAPLDYGSPLARRFLAEQAPFERVLSFAALKHVRSERDVYSILRMLEVNVLAGARFLEALAAHGHGREGVFFVSTDKAARPTSLMGASKRVMEQLLWAHADSGASARVTSARFANVAFSDGSLPWAFLQRLEKRQPLALPCDVRRYLLSPREAGELCLLAACVAPHRQLLVPRLDPERDLVSFEAIARATLADRGLEAALYEDEPTARAAVERDLARGRYPVLVTRADTSGEKEIEEFVAPGEQPRELGLRGALAIEARDPLDPEALRALLDLVARGCAGDAVTREALVASLGRLVPDLQHRDTGKSLDARM